MLQDPADITIVGLGPGDPAGLTLAARDALAGASVVVARIAKHPALLTHARADVIRDCDDLYRAHDRFDAVYPAIVERVMDAAREGPVVYAVPGDPGVGETTVALLRGAAANAGMRVAIVAGVSFIGPTLAALGWDALDGVQVADATTVAPMHHPPLDPDRPALVAQLYGRLVASDVKLVLLNQYPDDHLVTCVSGAGTARVRVEHLSLVDLDRRDEAAYDDLTTLAVPPLARPGSLLGLAEIIAHLRAPDGCPWDREQTHASLRPYMLEEAYEAVAAIDASDEASLADELGDVLLQVVLHAQIAIEEESFGLADVIAAISEKLIRRHPHVFGEAEADTSEAVLRNWDALKTEERRAQGSEEPEDPLAGVPVDMPALMRAQQVQHKARSIVTASVADSQPFQAQALPAGFEEHPGDERERARRIGETLWSLTMLARSWDVDAESALREATSRFEHHVRSILRSPTASLAPSVEGEQPVEGEPSA